MLEELLVESKIFEDRRGEFEKDHPLEWVVIFGSDYVGFFEDFQLAAQTAVEKFSLGPYLIKQIGVPTPSLPASLIYHPI